MYDLQVLNGCRTTVLHAVTSLASISRFVEVLLDEETGPLSDERWEYLEIVQRGAGRLLTISDHLLDVMRSEAGRVELVLQPRDLAALIEAPPSRSFACFRALVLWLFALSTDSGFPGGMMESNDLMQSIEQSMKPYRGQFPTFRRLPREGRDREEILEEMRALYKLEESKWKDGYVSGTVYHGDQEHVDFLNEVYAINSQSNPLHFDTWPSSVKFEAEIVSMTANMLGADKTEDEIVGTVSSGGTESILLAMKTYREWGWAEKWITEPEMIVPTTAHAAFDKASQFFNIKAIRVPVGDDFRADVEATRAALTKNTVVIVGSAPQFPHGIIDPIEELSELARAHNVGFHTDACLGGFVLPWAEKLGYDVPPFDFRLPGVTSMSADTHKYGYAAKGTSVVLYRGNELRRHQYYMIADWPGGLYLSPTLAGSRPGALSAACWAALVSIGEKGYLEATRRILGTADQLKQAIGDIPELVLFGDPLFDIAFSSHELDIYAISDQMGKRGWSLNGLQHPPCVHLCLTLRHTQPGLVERFIVDLQESVEWVRAHPDQVGRMGPIYGMASSMALGGAVKDILKDVLDIAYSV